MMKKFMDYIFPCIPVIFKSDYSLAESVHRLQSATNRSVFSSFFKQSAVGRVDEGKVRLQRVIPFFGNSFKPIFVGTFVKNDAGVILDGKWTTFLFARIFSYIWFAFIAVWTIVAAVGIIPTIIDSPTGCIYKFETYFPLIGVCFIVSGIYFNRFCWWLSRSDMDYLAKVISKSLSKESLNQEDTPDLKPVR